MTGIEMKAHFDLTLDLVCWKMRDVMCDIADLGVKCQHISTFSHLYVSCYANDSTIALS